VYTRPIRERRVDGFGKRARPYLQLDLCLGALPSFLVLQNLFRVKVVFLLKLAVPKLSRVCVFLV
jgi:hypothetical protein